MKRGAVNFLVLRHGEKKVLVSFNDTERLTVLGLINIRNYLLKVISKPGTRMEIDLDGVHFIDNEGFDTLTLLSRVGKNYDSKVILKNIEPEVEEMMVLAKKYYIFDGMLAEPAC